MKKLISAALAAVTLVLPLLILSSCGRQKYDLVLITDTGSVTDKDYNQSAWTAMTEFAIERNLDCRYFVPSGSDKDALLSQIRAAADDGAKVIVLPGSLFEVAANTAQREYPEVKFILIDGKPHPDDTKVEDVLSNTAALLYASEQAGFLAGYAAVKDGYKKLGFMGGTPDEDTQAYGCGFLQGVKYAADEGGVTAEVTYCYTDNTDNNDTNKKTAETMYENGVDVIFTHGGDLEFAVLEAAAEKRSYAICSDRDKRHVSSTVLSSAVKGVTASLKLVLRSIYDTKDFEYSFGGKVTYFDAAHGGAGLASFVINDSNGNAFDRFLKFTKEDYDAILSELVSGDITVKRDITVYDPAGHATAEELISSLHLDGLTVTVLQGSK